MLLINASRGPSKIHGFGLIAREFIPEGKRIWEFVRGFDQEIHASVFVDFPAHTQEQIKRDSLFCEDGTDSFFLLPGDDDRFTNHSDTPNSQMDSFCEVSYAIRDIQEGEEITENYNSVPKVRHLGRMGNVCSTN